MSRAFIADVLKDSAGISGVSARQTANTLIGAIVAEIKTNGTFNIPGFGTFRIVETKARKGLNPRTGEPVKIKPGRTMRFKVSPALKKGLRGARGQSRKAA